MSIRSGAAVQRQRPSFVARSDLLDTYYELALAYVGRADGSGTVSKADVNSVTMLEERLIETAQVLAWQAERDPYGDRGDSPGGPLRQNWLVSLVACMAELSEVKTNGMCIDNARALNRLKQLVDEVAG